MNQKCPRISEAHGFRCPGDNAGRLEVRVDRPGGPGRRRSMAQHPGALHGAATVSSAWDDRKFPSKIAIPSGKHTKNYGKSPFLMGKSTINGPFSTAMLVYRRVYHCY